jgi:hypothetical protein
MPMPTQPRPGKKGLYVELPNDLDTALRSYCEQRGLKLADEVRLAIRRHLANPPKPAEVPPLPPISAPEPTAEQKPAPKPKGKGKK